MRGFEVLPLDGVPPVKLGMRKSESRRAMSSPFEQYEKTPGQPVDAYLNSAFQVFFDDDDAIEYIELSNCSDFSVVLQGINVFATPAQELVTHLSRETDLGTDDGGYSYVSMGLALSLWRPVLPWSADHQDGRFFETEGVGVVGYFADSA